MNDEIKAIVKHRYETGAYGNAHFRMPSALWAEMRESAPPRPAPLFGGPALDQLLAIPILVDEDLPARAWQLVDNTSKDVLFEGVFEERAA